MLGVALDSSVLTDHSYLIITDVMSPLYARIILLYMLSLLM